MGGKCCWRHFRVYSCRDTLKFAGAAEAVNRFFSSPRCVLRKSVACLRIQLPISSSLVLLHSPFFRTGFGSISAILRRQSDSVSCGPETKVPLTLVEYQPDSTPRRSASSVLTCRGERFCIGLLSVGRSRSRRTADGLQVFRLVQLSPQSLVRSAMAALTRSR